MVFYLDSFHLLALVSSLHLVHRILGTKLFLVFFHDLLVFWDRQYTETIFK